MIHLVKHFLLRMRARLVLGTALLLALFEYYQFRHMFLFRQTLLKQGAHIPRFPMFFINPMTNSLIIPMLAGLTAELMSGRDSEEFDLALAAGRRALYTARNLAAATLIFCMAAVTAVAPWAAGVFQDGGREVLKVLADSALFWIAFFLVSTLLFRVLKRAFSPLVSGLASVGSLMIIAFLLKLLISDERLGTSTYLPGVIGAIISAAAWFLGDWQFRHYEVAPSWRYIGAEAASAHIIARSQGGSVLASVDGTGALACAGASEIQRIAEGVCATRLKTEALPADAGLLDRLTPVTRFLACALWLQWWYLLWIGSTVLFTLMAMWRPETILFFYMVLLFSLLSVLSTVSRALSPLISGRMILRSTLAPVVATPVLVGGIEAAALDSVRMALWGMAIALCLAGATWIGLPSRKEYGRPFRMRARRILSFIPLVCFAWVFVMSTHELSGESVFPTPVSRIVEWADNRQLLACCAIVSAMALLWWGCERKFKYFEPFAFPACSGDHNAA